MRRVGLHGRHKNADRNRKASDVVGVEAAAFVTDEAELVVAHVAVGVELDAVGLLRCVAIVRAARDQHLTRVEHGRAHVAPTLKNVTRDLSSRQTELRTLLSRSYRVGGVDKLAWLAELNEALFQVVERTLDEHFLLFVVVEQVIPQWLLRQHFRVSHNDHTEPATDPQQYIWQALAS